MKHQIVRTTENAMAEANSFVAEWHRLLDTLPPNLAEALYSKLLTQIDGTPAFGAKSKIEMITIAEDEIDAQRTRNWIGNLR